MECWHLNTCAIALGNKKISRGTCQESKEANGDPCDELGTITFESNRLRLHCKKCNHYDYNYDYFHIFSWNNKIEQMR